MPQLDPPGPRAHAAFDVLASESHPSPPAVGPRGERHRRGAKSLARLGCTLAALMATLPACGDSKTSDKKPVVDLEPKRIGDASQKSLLTGLGPATAIREPVPANARWDRVISFGDNGAVVSGGTDDETLALVTKDGGKTWHVLRAKAEPWTAWSASADGAVVAMLAGREKPPPPPAKGPRRPPAATRQPPFTALAISFSSADGVDMSIPVSLLGKEALLATEQLDLPAVVPAVLGSELAGLATTAGLVYTVPPTRERPAALSLPAGERFLPAAYGRPPMLVSLQGSDIVTRPWPKPGETLATGTKVAGARADGNAWDGLATAPECEFGAWSFQRIGANGQATVVGISPDRSVAFALPKNESKWLGCSDRSVLFEAVDDKSKAPTLVRCGLDGKCVTSHNPPFQPWVVPHESAMAAAGTPKGGAAVMEMHSTTRWGLYFSQSIDDGATFEVSRSIGEGAIGPGRIELGAIVSMPARLLLLLSGDIAGTQRRGWYVLVSDDGGTNWSSP